MILSLIKKINNVILELLSLLPNSRDYIDINNINITIDVINISTISELSIYLFKINYYLYSLQEIKKTFNENIIFKKQEIENILKEIKNKIYENIELNISDYSIYIKNSNIEELNSILYIIYITSNKNEKIINEVKNKMNDENVYLRHEVIYNYDNLLYGKISINDTMGLTTNLVKNTKFINNSEINNYTKYNKNKIKEIKLTSSIGNKYINNFLNEYFMEKTLTPQTYTNKGKLIDVNKSNEIKIYNEYVRSNVRTDKAQNFNNLEISIFEAFSL